VESPSSNALWTELVRSDERIAALYVEANKYAEEIETLCIQIAKSARAKGDQELLDTIERINQEVSDEMAEHAKTFGEFLRDTTPRTDQRELIADALDASKRVQESMKTSRERLLVLREKLKRIAHPETT
jgi:hypothetical protein